VFFAFSVPGVLVSDNAKCFVSKEFKQFRFGLGIKHVTTTPYYPQPSHGERFNRNLRSALIAFHSDSQTTRDENLSWLQLATLLHRNPLVQLRYRLCFPYGLVHLFFISGGLKISFRIAALRAASVGYGVVFIATFFPVMRLQPGGTTAVGYLILLR
jgi:transposase InsO family protein